MTGIIGVTVSVNDHNSLSLFYGKFWFHGRETLDGFLDNLHKILDIPPIDKVKL